MRSDFYNQNGELDDNYHPRSFSMELEMALSAMDCVLHGEESVYVSTQLTTGPRLYAMLRETRTKTADELKEKLGEPGYQRRVWQPNLEAAVAFVRQVRRHFADRCPIVSPASFSAPGWSQPEYLAFWDAFIRRRARLVYFNQGWEYSRGCSYEYVVALDAGVPTLDADGRPLDRERAVGLLRKALGSLRADGFEPLGLAENLARLENLNASLFTKT